MINDIVGIRLQGANFSSVTDLKLFTSANAARACLVYGKNGSGKSTISRAFSKIKGNDESTITTAELIDSDNNTVTVTEDESKQIFVFNEDYIDTNIRLHGEGLETIVVLGEQKELEDQITDARQKQENAQGKYDTQKEICDTYNDDTNVISPKYYKKNMTLSLKGMENWAGRDSKIKGNRQASNVRDDTYTQFINFQPLKTRDALIIEFNEKLIEYEEAKSGSKKIDAAVKTDYRFSFEETKFLELLAKKLEKPTLTNREKFLLNLATERGQGHLQEVKNYFSSEEHDICPYCMQSISQDYKDNLFLSIKKILSKASKEHQTELSSYQKQEISIDFEPYKDLDETLIRKCQNDLDEFNKLINVINDSISAKRENVYTPITMSEINIEEKFNALISSLTDLEKARVNFNENATDVSTKRTKLNEINNHIAYYDIKDTYTDYQKQLALKEQEDIKLTTYTTDLKDWEAKVKALEVQKKNIRIAMQSINDGLRYIFFSDNRLSIEYKNEKYYLLSRGQSVTPQKISVGERNAIALCYFFTDIMQNKEESEVYNKNYLLIIDDPVSSFDIENRVGILSYLKYQLQRFLCGNLTTKALMMTHDIQTFYDLKKLTEEIMSACKETFGSSQKYTFSIDELLHQTLNTFELKKRNEYSSLMENIFDYAQGTAPEYELVIGNSMRRVLEAFSTFLYKKGIDTVSTNPRVKENLPSPYDTYFEHLMYRLILHGGSHSEDHIKALENMDFFDYISGDEKERTAKDVLCFIYLLNNVHVLEHLSSKGNVQQTVEIWLNDIKNQSIS